ncbi:hypothetical protein EVAR_31145_1 [Eumeta japonica]|uniref:HAT C-terminal dimerisation domain-containing protein n=1 Tax=Eumeta variegata TaxID=151549 RepID=A0A4C1VGV1_EUMVA|nr:hypothetical protein EVAR_31145_1 [Eumeta japonica]
MILDSSNDDESQKTPEINSPDVILKKELLTFRNKKRINLNECPLKWWSVNQSEFKLLSKMERKLLSAPPASVPSGRREQSPQGNAHIPGAHERGHLDHVRFSKRQVLYKYRVVCCRSLISNN